MTPFEASLLSDSVGDLTRTLQGNRSLALQERGQQSREELARDEMAGRRQDRADLATHRETMAQIQREAKELQDRHYKLMQSTGLLKTLQDGLKDGTIKPEGLKGALADNPLLKDLGLSVDLFQAPAAKPGFDTREGHNLALAEKYRERANAARRNGGGDEAERFQAIADRLERGGSPEAEEFSTITENITEPGADPFAEPRAKVTRKVPSSRLEEEMRKLVPGAVTPPPAAGPAAAAPSGEQFESVGQAREKGRKPGDVILLWDPAQKKYRKFQLE